MKITILTTSDFPYHGATENFVRQMSKGLQINNAKIEVIRFWGERYSNINDTSIKSSNYLFKKPFKNELLKPIEALIQVLFIPLFIGCRKLYNQDKAIIMYGLDRAYFVFPVTILSKLFRIKCYRIISEIYPTYSYANQWWRKPLIFFYNIQLKYLDKHLNGVIVLSNFSKEICLKNKVKNDNLILIPHFIDLNIKKTIKKEKEIFSIGFCGSPTVENGVLDLIMAIDLISHNPTYNFELVIIGSISNDVEKRIEELNFNKQKIHFIGLLTKDQVDEELQKFHVLVNPRRSGILADSGFPTKLGEYFATKKPIVSTRVGDLARYFIDKNEIIFAEPNNPESLADAIIFAYKNKKESEKIGINGYNWAMENLDYVKNSKKLIDFIEKKHHYCPLKKS